jgi:hypothetical protein
MHKSAVSVLADSFCRVRIEAKPCTRLVIKIIYMVMATLICWPVDLLDSLRTTRRVQETGRCDKAQKLSGSP